MSTDVSSNSRPVLSRLHPAIYRIILGLALVLILSVWGFFGDRGYTGLVLGVVSLFVLISVGLPFMLWRISRRTPRTDRGADGRASFWDWTSREFEVIDGRLKGKDAAILVLLPIAAVCLGMTSFAIILHFVAGGAL